MTRSSTHGLLARLSVLLLCSCSTDTADGTRLGGSQVCEPPVALAVLPDVLREASGIAHDPRRTDLVWIHNDSGNDFSLYAFDIAGRQVAVVPVVGATDRDIEDMAIGPCPTGSCLYVGDIGDNLGVRRSISVHRVPLPDLSDPSPVTPEASWQLAYEDGARDAESLAVDAVRSELVVISKGRTGEVVLYAASIPALRETGSPNLLSRVGRLALPLGSNSRQLITAADISPDGSRLALRSYTTVYEFEWSGAAAFDTTVVPKWSSVMSAREPQGEGLAWDGSGQTLYLVGEQYGGTPPLISRVDCPSEEQRE